MSDASQWVLGVDGGGTKTVACITEIDRNPTALPIVHHVLGHAIAGASNPQAVGWDTALANLDAAIGKALAAAQATQSIGASPSAPSEPLAAAVLAMAGSDRTENRRRLLEWAERRRLAARLALAHDGQAVLAAGSQDYTGIALIAGTGSLAFGRDRSGKTARAGGWGFLASDEGSGYWIAVEGLRAAARSHDGYGDRAPTLARAFAAVLGADGFEAMIPRLYELADDRAAIARLSRVVWDVALSEGEGSKRDASKAVAWRILMQAANHWAQWICCVAQKLRWNQTKFTLVLGGGVFAGNDAAFNLLVRELKDTSLPGGTIAVVEDPVAGAVQLAHRLLARPPGVHSL